MQAKPYVALGIAALAVGLFVATTGCTSQQSATAPTPTDTAYATGAFAPSGTVAANGTGKQTAAPDRAEMSFGANTTGTDAKKVLSEASAQSDRILAAIKKSGIPAEDIQTAGINLYPQYDYENGKGSSRVTGYQASARLAVTIKDITKIGDVINAASAAGATEISGPSFTLAEDSEARASAIEKAVADSKARAEVMAKAAGKSVGGVVSISETGIEMPPIIYGERGSMAVDTGAAPEIAPGTLDITANVTVVFELK